MYIYFITNININFKKRKYECTSPKYLLSNILLLISKFYYVFCILLLGKKTQATTVGKIENFQNILNESYFNLISLFYNFRQNYSFTPLN